MEAPLENLQIVPNDGVTMSNENQSLPCPVPSKGPSLETTSVIELHQGDIPSSHLEISSPITGPLTEENVTKATTLIERVIPDLDENRKALLIKIFILYPNMMNMHPDWKPCYIKYMFMSLGDLLVLMNSTTPMSLDEAVKREIELVINELERNYCDKVFASDMKLKLAEAWELHLSSEQHREEFRLLKQKIEDLQGKLQVLEGLMKREKISIFP
ncbi:uncharacterized protein G2W53_025947 [Senna tora]|uniref:Uncharacterized protein n=1 Tax=Senna tora TaxID=362788 RepID=A0A834WF90_9FABA|nr:uncharacterized protein G2W53_025947 [Senna tora]